MKKVSRKTKECIGYIEKTTVLNGFHFVYPSTNLFERYIEDGRKEVVEAHSLLPKELVGGGYNAKKITIIVRVSPIKYSRQ